MDEERHHCLFENIPRIFCKQTTSDLYLPKKERIETICESSKKRGDRIHLEIQEGTVIYIHRLCASTYCSSDHIARALNKVVDIEVPVKRLRRDVEKGFNYKDQCVFCGDQCKKDNKHPERTKRFSFCSVVKNIVRPDGEKRTFKEEILRICDLLKDDQSEK